MAYAEQAIALTEKGGYRWENSMTIFGLGYTARSLGKYDQARSRFRASLPFLLN